MAVIPDTFMLAGNRWRVLFKPKKQMVIGDDFAYGLCDPESEEIWIYKRLGDKKRLQTFIHEVAHAVLYTMGHIDHDEVAVEGVSQLVYQMLTSGENYTCEAGENQASGSVEHWTPDLPK